MKYIQVLAVVIMVCFLAYFFIRFGLRPMYRAGGSGNIKIIDRIPLDARGTSALLLVQVGEAVLLVGVAQGGINLVKEIPPGELKEAREPGESAEGTGGGTFSGWLKKFYRP